MLTSLLSKNNKLILLVLGWTLICPNTLYSQNAFSFITSVNITSDNEINVIDIDGVSSVKYFSVLTYDRSTLSDSVIFFNKVDYTKHSSCLLKDMPYDYVSVVITDTVICFLTQGNKVLIYRKTQDRYLFSNEMQIADKDFAYNELLFNEASFSLYLGSTQSPVDYKNKGFLKVIEVEIQPNDTTLFPVNLLNIKQDSLNFLSIYNPKWMIDKSKSGTLGIVDFEGNVSLLKDGKNYKVSLLKSDYTTKDKAKVLSLQKSYNRIPTSDKLEKLDDYVVKHKRSVGLLLSDSLLLVTYHYYDSGISNSISMSFATDIYSYNLDETGQGLKITKLYTRFENSNKLPQDSTSEVADFIDLSGVNKSKKFVSGNYLYILEKDILGFMDSYAPADRTKLNYFRFARARQFTNLLIFKLN